MCDFLVRVLSLTRLCVSARGLRSEERVRERGVCGLWVELVVHGSGRERAARIADAAADGAAAAREDRVAGFVQAEVGFVLVELARAVLTRAAERGGLRQEGRGATVGAVACRALESVACLAVARSRRRSPAPEQIRSPSLSRYNDA